MPAPRKPRTKKLKVVPENPVVTERGFTFRADKTGHLPEYYMKIDTNQAIANMLELYNPFWWIKK